MHHGINELLFTALRIHHLHLHHLNALIAKLCNYFADMGNGLRLVFLNCNGAGDVTHHLPQDSGSNHHLLSLFKEGAEVGGEVRLTFAAVYYNSLAL